MQKITPFLWFDKNTEEAVNFYVSVFSGRGDKDSRVLGMTRYGEAGAKASGMPKGSVMTIPFRLAGQNFTAINGGPVFKFTPAISLVIRCENQEEVDWYWDKLSEGGDPKAQQCGWLQDKYGLSWQVVPDVLPKVLQDKDPQKAQRVMQAMLHMKKIDIKTLEQAYSG